MKNCALSTLNFNCYFYKIVSCYNIAQFCELEMFFFFFFLNSDFRLNGRFFVNPFPERICIFQFDF